VSNKDETLFAVLAVNNGTQPVFNYSCIACMLYSHNFTLV